MQALMMDAPLTLDILARRAEEVFPTRPVISRRNDRVKSLDWEQTIVDARTSRTRQLVAKSSRVGCHQR